METESPAGDPVAELPDGTGLCDDDRRLLLRLARSALTAYLSGDPPPTLPADNLALQRPCAVFVTLRDGRGALRGCRGEMVARRPMGEAVLRTVLASATADPRFPPVTVEEVDGLCIEISALSPLRPITPDTVEVGRHGLMLRSGPYVGVLLPQVPVAQGWDRDAYLDGLCLKAGLPGRAWEAPGAELLAFEAEVWAE